MYKGFQNCLIKTFIFKSFFQIIHLKVAIFLYIIYYILG